MLAAKISEIAQVGRNLAVTIDATAFQPGFLEPLIQAVCDTPNLGQRFRACGALAGRLRR